MKQLNTRSVVIILFVLGFLTIAIIDPQARSAFIALANVAVGGYFGQMYPQSSRPKANQQSGNPNI